MAENADKHLHDRAHTDDGWHTQPREDLAFESWFGQIPYPQGHHLSPEIYNFRQQDAVGCSQSNSLNFPESIQFYHPIQWPQRIRSDNYDLSSADSTHLGFGSDLELEATYSVVNSNDTEALKYQPALDHVDPSASDLGSSVSGLWPLCLLSYCTEEFS